jgi:hypothetical protein
VSANPDTTMQVNFKTPGGALINLYAGGSAELESLLVELNRLLPLIAATEADAAAAGRIVAQGPPPAPPVPQQHQAPAQQAPAYQQPAPAPAVAHPQGGDAPVSDKWGNLYWFDHPQAATLPDGSGKFVLKQGTSQKTNKPYKMWVDPIKAPNYPFDRNARAEFEPPEKFFRG